MVNTYTLTIYMYRDHRRFTGLSRVAVERYIDYYRVRDEYIGHIVDK